MPDFLLVFGVVAIILVVSSLASGLVERSPLSFPLIFISFGFLLGQRGFDVIDIGPRDPVLEVVATLTLALVLFLDGVKLQVDELGKRWLVPVLVLGPGTGLIIAFGAVPLALFLGFGWVMAFIGGAILASTDPVVLREIVRDHRIPRSIRQILRIEAGMNDIVVLPIILVLIAVAQDKVDGTGEWASFLVKLLVVGPMIGFAIGGIGSWLIARVDARTGIRLEYQALYGIGLVLAAYTAASVSGGDGFLGAFAAGLAVVLLNQKLCNCFLDYGEITAEVAMLLAFVLFGAVLSGIIGTADIGQSLLLAVLVIFVIRPSLLGLVLARVNMSREAHAFISWFGPRGLNSLLLALLVVLADLPGAELLLATVGIVVLVSVTVHGAAATPVSSWYWRKAARETLAEERESTAVGLLAHRERDVPLITPGKLRQILDGSSPPVVLDVRSRSSYQRDGAQIPSSVRVLPDGVTEWAAKYPKVGLVVAYCT